MASSFTITDSAGSPVSVTVIKEIGRGAEGIAYEAMLGSERVLLKKILFSADPVKADAAKYDLIKNIEMEIEIRTLLQSCTPTSNIACFRGFVWHPELMALIPPSFSSKGYTSFMYTGTGNGTGNGTSTGTSNDIYLIYDLIEGSELFYSIVNNTLTSEQMIRILTQLLTALQTLHAAGYTHRDIKPENLMLTPTGQLKIIDFGGACKKPCVYDFKVTGTLSYSAPESIKRLKGFAESQRENNSFPGDIFMAGMTFFTLVTGGLYTDVVNPGAGEPRVTIDQIDMYRGRKEPRDLFVAAGMEKYYDLFLSMIQGNPAARPTAYEALSELNRIRTQVAGVKRRYEKESPPMLQRQETGTSGGYRQSKRSSRNKTKRRHHKKKVGGRKTRSNRK